MPESEDIKELRKELRKLKLGDRLKRLKALEKKRKSEVLDIGDLIKDSEKELKADEVADEIIPEQIEVNIQRLFDEGEHLERTAREEAPETTEREEKSYVSLQQAYSDYTRLQDIAYASMMGPITSIQGGALDQIGERLDNTKYQTAGQEVANILVASRAALYKIKKYAGLESGEGY